MASKAKGERLLGGGWGAVAEKGMKLETGNLRKRKLPGREGRGDRGGMKLES